MTYIIEYYTNQRLIRFERKFLDETDAHSFKTTKLNEGVRFKIFREKVVYGKQLNERFLRALSDLRYYIIKKIK